MKNTIPTRMSYSEKFVNGNWWFKTDPDGIWRMFTYEQLLHKCNELKKELENKKEED